MFNLNKIQFQDLSNKQLYNNFILGTKLGVGAFVMTVFFTVGGIFSTSLIVKSLGDANLNRTKK